LSYLWNKFNRFECFDVPILIKFIIPLYEIMRNDDAIAHRYLVRDRMILRSPKIIYKNTDEFQIKGGIYKLDIQ